MANSSTINLSQEEIEQISDIIVRTESAADLERAAMVE